MFPINTYGWDLIDIAALVAPRPCLVASADRDRIFTLAGIREFHERLKRVTPWAGPVDKLALVESQEAQLPRRFSHGRVFVVPKAFGRTRDTATKIDDIDRNNDELKTCCGCLRTARHATRYRALFRTHSSSSQNGLL